MMNSLEKIIIDKIQREGPITFESFMDMALYYPGLGYYSCPDTLIGRKGDYYTSPHLHPIFGAMIARQVMEMWNIMQRPSLFYAVEIGAGHGYLCRDFFDYIMSSRNTSDFLNSMRYVIVEPYAHFKEKQKEVIGDYAKDIIWLKSLRDLDSRINSENDDLLLETFSGQITGCIFSNELLDAFPVHLIEMSDAWEEVCVSVKNDKLIEIKQDITNTDVINYINHFSLNLNPAYRTEVNTKIKKWLHEIADVLVRGFVLTIDYGFSAREYYSEDRAKGTLLCYYKHMLNEDPYQNIGKQDITAQVNFSSLKKWGDELGLETIGYCSQGSFLTASGIDEVISEMYPGAPNYGTEIHRIKGLIMPHGMGESHRVMIQFKGDVLPQLRGFSISNKIETLLP